MMAAPKKKEGTLKDEKKDSPVVRPEPEKILLEWESWERIFKQRDREFYTTVGAMVLLFLVILFILGEWFLAIVVIALSFFVYVMSTIEPGKVKHQITSKGLIVGGNKYAYGQLGRFWFDFQSGQKVLYVENPGAFPGRLVVLLGNTSDKKVRDILKEYLVFEEPEKTWMDNASSWLSRRVPIEKEK